MVKYNKKKYSKKGWTSQRSKMGMLYRSTRRTKMTPQRREQIQRIGGVFGAGSTASPFPMSLFTVMSYTETINIAQTVGGVPALLEYRANGPWDPRVAAGGLASKYYSSLLGANGSNAPYRKYRVFASKIKATVFNLNTSTAGNCIVSIIPARNTVTPPSTIDEMRERPYAKQVACAVATSYKPYVVTNFARIKNHLGHKDLMDIDGASALYNANPSEQVYYYINLCAVDPTTTASCRLQITIKYYVQCYELTDVDDG